MRYTVGQKYHFIFIDFEEVNRGLYKIYKPWEDTIHMVKIITAECFEHHKVTNGWDDKKDCYGFIFNTVENGELIQWHNQYPTASYGQLSTDNDWYIYPAKEKATEGYVRYEDVTNFLERIQRGITHFTEKEVLPQHSQSLQIFYNKLVDYLYLTKNVGVINTPFIVKYIDEREPEAIPEMRKISIVSLSDSRLSNVVWSEQKLDEFHKDLIETLNNIKKK